jgi:hypothetical protein
MEQVKKVLCVNNTNVTDRLTIGKEYNVVSYENVFDGTKFYVYNDKNKLDWYLGDRFIKIDNTQTIELRKEPIKSATQSLAETQTNNEPKTEKKQTDRKIRVFETGAIRSDNTGRERFDFISPLALKELAQYLATSENSFAQVNYFKGIPEDACLESLLRHINDYQLNGKKSEAIALLFNAVALVHTIALKERGEYVKVQEGTKLISESEYKNLNVTYNYKENN